MKKKVDKNLVLMDDILEVIGQSDEWEDIQLHDPRIVAARQSPQGGNGSASAPVQ